METWEGDEQEMFRLQDRTALIPDVSSWTVTLIERITLGEEKLGQFSGFSHSQCNANPRGWGYIFIGWMAAEHMLKTSKRC